MKTVSTVCALMALTCVAQGGGHSFPADPARYVNPFLGNANGGNTTPAARAPFGMISPGPMTVFERYGTCDSRTGYDARAKEIIAFNLTHLSGVGLHAAGDLPFMPVVGDLAISPVAHKRPGEVITSKADKEAYKSKFSTQRAEPGWYQVRLDDPAITVGIVAALRSCMVRLDYPRTAQAGIVFCPANDIKGIRDASLAIDPEKRTLSGWVATGGFSDQPFRPTDNPYRIYFRAQFDHAFTRFGTWEGASRTESSKGVLGDCAAAYLGFDTTRGEPVHMRLAISYVDEQGAEKNLATEQKDWDFDGLRQRTRAAWNQRLNLLPMDGGTETDRRIWATSVYLNMLHPNIFEDVDGRYIGFDDKIHSVEQGHHFYANYSNWDTYRTTGPLQAMLVPQEAGDMATTMLLAAAQGGGGLLSWALNNNDTRCMGTYPGSLLLANYMVFGARNVDLNGAKNRLVDSATRALPCKKAFGWGDLDKYIRLGWKPGSASETLEFAVTDFAISRICEMAGDQADAARFRARSGSWTNLVHPEHSGIWAREEDGSWIGPLAPDTEKGFTEGCSEQYMWCVPHDTAGLITKLGKPAEVEARLTKFFDPFFVGGWHTKDPKYWDGNEPTLGNPYVFNYLGAPWKAQELVSRVAGTFLDAPDGLPGNDDLGTTSASYLFSALGLYPYIPGVGGFIITGPRFACVEMVRKGKRVKINAVNAGPQNPYIQSLKVNGKPWTRTWIGLDDLKAGRRGATLDFVMGPQPNKKWGSRPEDAPPSFGSAGK